MTGRRTKADPSRFAASRKPPHALIAPHGGRAFTAPEVKLDYSIEQGAIVLRNPSAIDVGRSRAGFMLLFDRRPQITIRGMFPAGAVKDHPEEELRLLDPPAASVVLVGRVYLTIAGRVLGHRARRVIELQRGRGIEVRLRLPAGGSTP